MDKELTNSLWNLVAGIFDAFLFWRRLAAHLAQVYFRFALDEIPLQDEGRARRTSFYNGEWWERYNLVEFIIREAPGLFGPSAREKLVTEINLILGRELAGYRFTEDRFTPISQPRRRSLGAKRLP